MLSVSDGSGVKTTEAIVYEPACVVGLVRISY